MYFLTTIIFHMHDIDYMKRDIHVVVHDIYVVAYDMHVVAYDIYVVLCYFDHNNLAFCLTTGFGNLTRQTSWFRI